MHVVCPCCNSDFPIEAGLIEIDGKRLATVMAELDPSVGRALIGYLRLFKPAKSALRMSRAAKIARDVADLVAAGDVCRDERGSVRRASTPSLWAQGMEQMASQRDRLTLPIDSHGYLRAIVFGLADKADAAAERSREDQLRSGRRPTNRLQQTASKLDAATSFAASMFDLGQRSREEADEYVAKVRFASP